MRDSVSVLGGFPVGKFPAPGMNERRALMSNVVAIPKSKENEDLDAADYETILQISDVNPKSSNTAINTAAIKLYDNGPSIKWNFTKFIDDTLTHLTDNYYRWEATGKEEVSATYVRYPDMLGGGSNVWSQRHKINKSGATANYFVAGNEVFGGQTWTFGQHVVYAYFGPKWKDPAFNDNQGWQMVYEDIAGNVNYASFQFNDSHDVVDAYDNTIDTVPRGMAITGFMKNMSAWQTMKMVPAGPYQLEIDLGAYYINATTEENTGITFCIEDAQGTIVASQPVFSSDTLRRYIFDFEQPEEGDLTIRVMSAPGSLNPTPSDGANATLAQIRPFQKYMTDLIISEIEGDTLFATEKSEDIWWYDGERIQFRTPNYNKILRELQVEPESTYASLQEITGISIPALQKLMQSLADKGYIEKSDKHGWRVFITPSM
jgi:hypothetical protein